MLRGAIFTGPYSVSHYNQNVRRWTQIHGAHSDAFYLELQEGPCISTDSTEGGDRYICYRKGPLSHSGVGHFFAISISYDTRAALISGDSLSITLRMDLSDLSAHIAGLQPYIFRATQEEPMGARTSWPYAADEGALIRNSYYCSMSNCVHRGKPLARSGGNSGDCLRIPRW